MNYSVDRKKGAIASGRGSANRCVNIIEKILKRKIKPIFCKKCVLKTFM